MYFVNSHLISFVSEFFFYGNDWLNVHYLLLTDLLKLTVCEQLIYIIVILSFSFAFAEPLKTKKIPTGAVSIFPGKH